jgi:N-acetylglucosamine-6-sulfatase
MRTDRWLYVEYKAGERELYDLLADPNQLDSLHADPHYQGVRGALQSALQRLQDCAGRDCRTPVNT